jgi:tRNA(Ile)-lysidine synthase
LRHFFGSADGISDSIGVFYFSEMPNTLCSFCNFCLISMNETPIEAYICSAQELHHWLPAAQADKSLQVVVGVSGGADSICLLDALYTLQTRLNLALHVAHLDHNLRSDSAQDAASVAAIAQKLGLPCHSARLEAGALDNLPGGMEAAARQARYRFLGNVAINVTPSDQVPLVAVAHHAEDQAETVLLNLLRGSGLRGLAAMRWHSALPGNPAVRLVRPLLGVRRSQILEHLQQRGLSWRDDHTNTDLRFARNRLRYAVLPQLAAINPSVVDVLAQTAERMAAESERSERLDRQRLAELRLSSPDEGRVVLDLEGWRQLPLAEQRGVLRLALDHLRQKEMQDELAAFATIERLCRKIARPTEEPALERPQPLLAGIDYCLLTADERFPLRLSLHRHGQLPVYPMHPHGVVATNSLTPIPLAGISVGEWRLQAEIRTAEKLPVDWKSNPDRWQAWLDVAACPEPMLARPQTGMRFAPLGLKGRHKFLGDFFTDRKVPTWLRLGWPLVIDAASREIVWVCGLAVAHPARIQATTQHVLHLVWLHTESGQST